MIVVDEVAETLHTMHSVVMHLWVKLPASVRICVLIAKPDCHKREDVKLGYVGFSEPNLPFLKGYGMDERGAQRALPHIAVCE